MKSLILPGRGALYQGSVQTDAPAPHGVEAKPESVCHMSLPALGHQLRRFSPTLLTLAMAMLVVGFAAVGLTA